MKSSILFIFFFGVIAIANATEYEGYIINNTGDTVKGQVDVVFKKALIGKKEIDFGEMEMAIKFSEKGAKSKKMKAGDIAGYGFNYEGTWYHLEVLDMQKNSGQKGSKILGKMFNNFTFFIHRLYDGSLPVYKDYIKYGSDNPNSQPGVTTSGYDLYVKNNDGIFVEIASPTPGGNKKFKEFLKKYLKLEDAFLNTVDDKAKFSDAEEILVQYNEWKKKNP